MLVVAVGTPPEQDTTIVTSSVPDSNVTLAVAAGPRTSELTSNPWAGLQDRRNAPVDRQLATTVPPDEVSTVLPAEAGAAPEGEPDGAALDLVVGFAPRGLADGPAPAGVADVPLASALFTAEPDSCSLGDEAMPCPSRDTARRLPPVATPAPTTQAPTPMKTRFRMYRGCRNRP